MDLAPIRKKIDSLDEQACRACRQPAPGTGREIGKIKRKAGGATDPDL